MKTRADSVTRARRVVCLAVTFLASSHFLGAGVLEGPLINPANQHAYYLLESTRWTVAEAQAVALGGHLVTINDQAENDWVSGLWGDRSPWIGLNDAENEGTFVWGSGDDATYRNWEPGQPDDGGQYSTTGEDYAYIRPVASGVWNDLSPYHSRRGVVEVEELEFPIIFSEPEDVGVDVGQTAQFEVQVAGAGPLAYQWQFNSADLAGATSSILVLTNVQLADAGTYTVVVSNTAGTDTSLPAVLTVQATELPASLVGPVFNPDTGHQYFLLEHSMWLEAEAAAQALGGHLTTINDADEQAWVFDQFGGWGGPERQLWIGLYDANQSINSTNPLARQSEFVWASGEPVLYANWQENQPDNSGGSGEFYVHMVPLNHPDAGKWNDAINTASNSFPFNGVVEAPGIPVILSGPETALAAEGQTAQFEVQAAGGQPLAYQWRVDGSNLAGATSPMLVLTNVQRADAGAYSVVVSNAYGTATSSDAVLTVLEHAVDGLVAYYPFDDGTAFDATGNGHDGLVNSATWSAQGAMGGAFTFDGIDDFVRIADHPDLNAESFTVTHWVKLSPPSSVGGSFAKARALSPPLYRVLWFPSSLQFSVHLWGDPDRTSLATPFGPYFDQWTMVTIVASGLRQTVCNISSFARPRLTFSRMSVALAVHTNGLGAALCLRM